MRDWRRLLLPAVGIWATVSLLAFAGVHLIRAVYESTGIVEVSSRDAKTPLPADLSERAQNAAFDPKELEELAKSADTGETLINAAIARVRESIGVEPRDPGSFVISFRSNTPVAAQKGCEGVSRAIISRFDPTAAVGGTDARARTLEAATHALDAFIVAHPGIVGEATKPEPRPTPLDSARTDALFAKDRTLVVLRWEKHRLDTELAAATNPTAVAPAPSSDFGPNPYNDPPPSADPEAIKRRLAELRIAITERQKAVVRDSTAPPPSAASQSPEDVALRAQWTRLVQAMTDAEHAQQTDAPSALVARVIAPASLPTSPLHPTRLILGLLGSLFGLGSGFAWIVARMRHTEETAKPVFGVATRSSAPPRGPTPVEPVRATESGPSSAVFTTSPNLAVAVPPSASPHLSTQRGVIDVAAVLAQTGVAPATLALEPKPTVGITRTEKVEAHGGAQKAVPAAVDVARATTTKSDPPAAAPPRPRSDPPKRSPLPPRPSIDERRPTASSRPGGVFDVTVTSPGGLVRPSSAAPRPASDPPRVTTTVVATVPPPRAEQRSSPPDDTRPSQIPLRPRPTISPPPIGGTAVRATSRPAPHSLRPGVSEHSPDTQRIGSPRESVRPSSPSNAPRFDTTYSIVNRAASKTSRPPAPAERTTPPAERTAPPAERKEDGFRRASRSTQPLVTPPGIVRPTTTEPLGTSPEAGRRVIEAPTPPEPEPNPGTKTGWEPPQVTNAETAMVRHWSTAPQGSDDVVVPRSLPPSWRPPHGVAPKDAPDELKQIRDQLVSIRGNRCFVLGITSEEHTNGGKTKLAVKLAELLAESARVLLMEANFDWPGVQRALAIDMPRASGFSQQIHARIRDRNRGPWTVTQCSPSLHVLAEGIMRSPGILFSQEFAMAVTELRTRYDFIVADGPTVGTGGDLKPLNGLTDGIVVVVHPKGDLPSALDTAAKWFTQKEFAAAVFADADRDH